MGGDYPPQKLFEAVMQFVKKLSFPNSLVDNAEESIVAGIRHAHASFLSTSAGKKITLVGASQVIGEEESPLQTIRRKKDSSIALGVRMHAEGKIDALISPGNTGVLILSAILTLKCLPGIDRPALLATLPSEEGPVAVLDVGANVSCKPQHLIQFAMMGSVYQQCSAGIDVPRVGLLNIGVEAQKGTANLREVYKALDSYCKNHDHSSLKPKMQFVGNVEGREVFQGKIDVLVTDGFTGNVFLKTAEGASSFILNETRRVFKLKIPDESKYILQSLNRHLDYSEYPGAILCGIDGVVVKVHGSSGPKGLFNGIKGIFHLLEQNLVKKIKKQLHSG
jgi:glycerol-3-phosphate acyltransferase PlsX